MDQVVSGEQPAQEAPEVPVESQALDTPPQEAPTPESEAQDAKPKADPVQKRIDQLTWQKHEAERRLNAEIMNRQKAEQQALDMWRQQQELMRRATTPTMESVNFDPDAYSRAVQEHNERYMQQQENVRRESWERQQQAAAHAQFESHLNARVAEGAQKYTDYAEVVGNPSLPPLQTVNPVLLNAILEHERMPDITYYLGKNPAEAHRIASLPPARAIMEVGMIAARIPSGGVARPTSNAPAPASTVGGNQRANSGPSDSDSIDDWIRKRNAQLRRQ